MKHRSNDILPGIVVKISSASKDVNTVYKVFHQTVVSDSETCHRVDTCGAFTKMIVGYKESCWRRSLKILLEKKSTALIQDQCFCPSSPISPVLVIRAKWPLISL